ncbi:MAG: YbhB/YbcL family Raf kinase inhibitor-like protein [Candidatus Velthaea sp.]|jgi:Raf kinase inhibitor-like YbhB/YbcL family protein
MKLGPTLLAALAIALLGGMLPAAAQGFSLRTPAFAPGGTMPGWTAYGAGGCSGENASPRLEWSGVPAGTKSFVLTVYDPDAPVPGGWWHWVRYDVPAGLRSLPAGSRGGSDGRDGTNTFGTAAYGGPCPPRGDQPHHYHFVLRALDIPTVGASAATTGPQLERLVAGHVLGEARLTGRFGRPR